MATPIRTTLPNTNPGKTWRLSAYTFGPQGAWAVEGVQTPTSFTFEITPGSGSHPATVAAIAKPATAKRKKAAIEQLKQQLIEAGLATAA